MKKLICTLITGGLILASAALAQTGETEPAASKDLILEWANFTEEGIVFSIKNDGKTDIAGRLETLFEWLQCGGAETCKRTKNVFTLVRDENILEGEQLILESKNIPELQAWIKNKPFGVDRVRVEVDPANKIKEENKTNNTWEETPISPRTSGERLAKRDEHFKDVSVYPKILPGNKLYIVKDVWRNVRMMLTFGEEKKIQKRQELIRERLIEIQRLVERGEGKEIPNVLAKIREEWKKVKDEIDVPREKEKTEKLRTRAIEERLKEQLVLEDVVTNISTEAITEDARKKQQELLVELGGEIRALQNKEERKGVVEKGLGERNKSPLFPLRQLKILRLLENLLPEEEILREIKGELVDTLELRVLYLPEDIRGGLGGYAASINKDKNNARELLGYIEEVMREKGTKGREKVLAELKKANERLRKQIEGVLEEVRKEKSAPKTAPKELLEFLDEKPKDAKIKEPEEEKTICTAEYNPVCGEDDVTYANACVAEEQNKVKIAEKGECKLPKPDLYVKKTEILPKDPRENDFLTIGADVVNDGGTAQKLFKTRMRIDADINGIYDVIPNEYPLNLIHTSSTKSISWENVWEAKEGVHKIELCVDSGRAIAELNEENNCTLLAFEVGPKATSTQTMATSTDRVATSTNTLSTSTGVGD
ncbi:MAG: CARDB domain-containing protein [bacterium]|nr:CARDB domain-containing protein [bacterium]